jgi:amino acid transporter
MVNNKRFGTTPVFLTAVSTILGAILFLRFGFALGMLGFFGVILLIIVGHLVTIPTALAVSEIATNQRVESGGEYYIISRSFGLNIGGTIGIAFYLSRAISYAFYIIALTEAFEPLFRYFKEAHQLVLPRQAVSIPILIILSIIILKKGANIGIAMLYIVVAILGISLILFFVGSTAYSEGSRAGLTENPVRNFDDFFMVFAIIFPAFTGMTAGVGLSGDLKNPVKAIPRGTILATIAGFIIYILIAWKLIHSAAPKDLINDQLIMREIAVWGTIVIPLGLAASTFSSAIGSILVAPRILQALANDRSLPGKSFNRILARGKPQTNEPYNATILTVLIAFVFVVIGDINIVASIITMFFMVTYGSLCLISFLNHFGAAPSYRPSFRSHYLISLLGFLASLYLMFRISTSYAFLSLAIMTLIYIWMSYTHKERQGIEAIFRSALFQINRNMQVFLQRPKTLRKKASWHPSIVCVTEEQSDMDNAFNLLTWISHRYGFGTYIRYINGYYSTSMHQKSKEVLQDLVERAGRGKSHVYVDTIVSPSYTSAIAQIIQLPGIAGMENNMILFEFDKKIPDNLSQIVENIPLARAGNYDIAVLGGSKRAPNFDKGIHIWIKKQDIFNLKLMILLSHIILSHPDWHHGKMTIFNISGLYEKDESRQKLYDLVNEGRLPISMKNVEFIDIEEDVNIKSLINKKSAQAGLTMIGFLEEQLKHDEKALFEGYEALGDVLFVSTVDEKEA